jgi:hypothetical protein
VRYQLFKWLHNINILYSFILLKLCQVSSLIEISSHDIQSSQSLSIYKKSSISIFIFPAFSILNLFDSVPLSLDPPTFVSFINYVTIIPYFVDRHS